MAGEEVRLATSLEEDGITRWERNLKLEGKG